MQRPVHVLLGECDDNVCGKQHSVGHDHNSECQSEDNEGGPAEVTVPLLLLLRCLFLCICVTVAALATKSCQAQQTS